MKPIFHIYGFAKSILNGSVLRISRVLTLFFLVLNLYSWGQEAMLKSYPYSVRVLYTSGHVAEHSKDISHMSRGYTNGFDLMISNLFLVSSAMEDRIQNTFLDLGFHYTKFPYEFTGESFAISMGKSGRILQKNRFALISQFDMGLGFGTRPYTQENNKNVAISTQLGFTTHAELTASYLLYKNWNLAAGIGFNHLSNGAIKRPNLGFNVFSTNVGLSYTIKEKTIEITDPELITSRRYFYHLIGTFFPTSNESFDGVSYPAYNFHFQTERFLSVHHSLLLSLDYTRDIKVPYPEIKDPENPIENDKHFLGLSLGGNWKFSIIDMDLTIGAYLIKPWHKTGRQYLIIHFKIYALKNKYFIVGLKAHRVQADVFETGIGIKF